MDGLKGIMLSEISQRKINAVWFHLCVESIEKSKTEKVKQRIDGM